VEVGFTVTPKEMAKKFGKKFQKVREGGKGGI
jgi:hypothetical protein